MRLWIAAALVLVVATPASAQNWLSLSRAQTEKAFGPSSPVVLEPARPDPTMTPGAVDPSVSLERICTESTRHRRPPSTRFCDRVFAAYSISPEHRYEYECDHDVPIALGGKTVIENLWPQPNVEADRKDRLEVELQRRACAAYRTLVPAEAAAVLAQEQREIAEDWVAAARKYLPTAPR